jgi:predicted ATPase|tara:strand:- start:957 stop:1469 length:513 start_codon:yes stop_codon:yes gene_type:complete
MIIVSIPPHLAEDEITLARTLERHVGERQAIKVGSLAVFIGDRSASKSRTRAILKNLTEIYGLPICTSTEGVFWASDSDEIADYCDNLKSRAVSLFTRIKALQKTIKTERFTDELKGELGHTQLGLFNKLDRGARKQAASNFEETGDWNVVVDGREMSDQQYERYLEMGG